MAETALTLAELRAEAAGCRRCPLFRNATQTVFGEGPAHASVMFVGEQPGDQEDLAGKPFVGPAGRLFDRALGDAGIDRRQVYVTNAVKHLNSSRAASGGCTNGPMPARSISAAGGSTARSP